MDSEKLTQGVENTFKNDYFFWIVMLFGIVFGWLARPPIPNWLLNLFENPLFQYLVLFGIVYTGSKNVKAAFISPLIFMFIMYLLSLGDKRKANPQQEGFYNEKSGRESEDDEGEEQDSAQDDEEDPENYNDFTGIDEENENFADQDVEQERKRLAMSLHKGLSDVTRSTSELYTKATDLVDTYSTDFDASSLGKRLNGTANNTSNTTTEGFYDIAACNSCMGYN
jgi:hypothetical protein